MKYRISRLFRKTEASRVGIGMVLKTALSLLVLSACRGSGEGSAFEYSPVDTDAGLVDGSDALPPDGSSRTRDGSTNTPPSTQDGATDTSPTDGDEVGDACDPFEPRCPVGAHCSAQVSGEGLLFTCVESGGEVVTGEECVLLEDCTTGTVCVPDESGTGHCLGLCDASHACEGAACAPLLFGEIELDLGVCVAGSAGDDPVPADGDLCFGTADVDGDIPASHAASRIDGGTIGLILFESEDTFPSGDRFWLISLAARPGVYSYPPTSGEARCGIVEMRGDAVYPVGEVSGCEIILSELVFSTSTTHCVGFIEGIFRGFVPGGDFVTGTFATTMVVREEDLGGGCLPYDAACSRDDDCCSGNCMVWGTCM